MHKRGETKNPLCGAGRVWVNGISTTEGIIDDFGENDKPVLYSHTQVRDRAIRPQAILHKFYAHYGRRCSMIRYSPYAPSEKHLEDWIVAHHDQVQYQGYENRPLRAFEHIIGRQVRTSAGVIDLLVWGNGLAFPVEVKRDNINAHDLVQLLTYMGDVDIYLKFITRRLDLPRMRGILIGHGYADNRLLRACASANVTVLVYSVVNNAYSFEHPQVHSGKILFDLLHTWPGPEQPR